MPRSHPNLSFRTVPLLPLFLMVAAPVAAATITVEGDCSLPEAIRAANSDSPVGGCPAGSSPGYDEIVLTHDVILNAVEEADADGANGLPIVTSTIELRGQHHTISRDPEALEEFRIAKIIEHGSLLVDRATVTGGRAEKGGAFFNLGGRLTLNRSTVSGNLAVSHGGAIYNGNTVSRGKVRILDSTFASNSTSNPFGDSYGGAIFSEGTLDVYRSVFHGNRAGSLSGLNATARGGAIAAITAWPGSGVGVYTSTFSANEVEATESTGGGALWEEDGHMRLENSTVSGNSSSGEAGAIQGGFIHLENVTLAGNHPRALQANGGANGVHVQGTILAGSTGANCAGSIIDDHNNVSDDASCGTIPAGLTGFDPNLEDHGGQSRTHALLPGSNAIDGAGFCDHDTDQRGAPRVEACDIGAYEYLGCPTLPLLTETVTTAETYEECAIRVRWVWVDGPDGDLTLRAGTVVRLEDSFSVGFDAQLTIEIDPSLELVDPALVATDRARRRDRER